MTDQTIPPIPPEGYTIKIYFANGKELEFPDCTGISEPPAQEGEGKLNFISGGKRYVFQKGKIAGWAMTVLPK
tara:strand:+ start:250 stop:468 length:219 start_codon:yes stop_codon:yes gene_type:complete